MIVLNDCPWQTIDFPCDDDVWVVNVPDGAPSLGEKRNELVRLAGTEWVTFLDDDDVLTPLHYERLVADRNQHDVIRATTSFYHDGTAVSMSGMLGMDVIVRRKIALDAFPALDNGEDQHFNATIEKRGASIVHSPIPTYVYCWGNGAHHVSGSEGQTGAAKMKLDAVQRRDRGEEPYGRITLPRWQGSWF